MTSKLSGSVPKGDGWGLESVLKKAVHRFLMTGRSEAIPCIAVVKIRKVDVEGDDGDTGHPSLVPTLEIRRIEALTLPSLVRLAREALERQVIHRRGVATLPSFEDKELLDEAFGDQYGEPEPDDGEPTYSEIRLAEQPDDGEPTMTADDRIRAHMIAVHQGSPDGVAADPNINEVRLAHQDDHDRGLDEGLPQHDVTWLGATPEEIEAAEADSDDENTAASDPVPATFSHPD